MDYPAAVRLAREILAGVESLPDEADKLAALVLHWIDREDMMSIDAIIAASERQLLSYEALHRAVAGCLLKGRSLPARLSEWAGRAMMVPESRPATPAKFKRGWPGATIARNILIYEAVCALQDKGVLPTHSDVTPGGTSGCDAVAEALRKAGSSVTSYKSVLGIYADIKGQIEDGRDPRIGVSVINDLINSTKYF